MTDSPGTHITAHLLAAVGHDEKGAPQQFYGLTAVALPE